MSFERSYREQINSSRRIPLHYQRRYLANISNGSFNATFLTGIYKNKVKSLLKNNKFLALALQNDRLKKEQLLAESKANADLIMFSKLKLSIMSENLKKVVSALDETVSMLQMHSSEGLKKFSPKNTVSKEEFKEQLRDVMMEPIIEETEPPQHCEGALKKTANQGPSISTDNQILPLQNTCISNDISSSLKPKISQKSIVTRKAKNKLLNELDCEISKEMFVKNSPLKEVYSVSHSNKEILKNHLVIEGKEKAVGISNEISKQKKHSSKAENIDSIKKEVHLNSQIEKSLFKNSKLTGSKCTKRKKSKQNCVKRDKEPADIKIDEITNFLHDLPKRKLCKNVKMVIPEHQIVDDNSINGSNKPKENVLCSNSVSTIPKILKKVTKECKSFKNTTTVNSKEVNDNVNPKEMNNKHKLEFCKDDQFEVKQSTKISHMQKRPLKCLSSKMNSENLINEKERKKSKISQIDDLTLGLSQNSNDLSSLSNKRKSCLTTGTDSLCKNKYIGDENTHPMSQTDVENYNCAPNFDSKLDYHEGEEMIKNLASNTFVVTAEIHNQLDGSSEKKVKHQKTDTIISTQPVVTLTDIFSTGKSLCKSISCSLPTEKNVVPLEDQLLKHCSTLKLLTCELPDEKKVNSLSTESAFRSSVDQVNAKDRETAMLKKLSAIFQESDKRYFRQRPSQLCYKEPSIHKKLRR